MPKVRDLVDCPLCFGRLMPLSVCQSCNSVVVRDGLDDIGPQIICEDCGATNATHFVCSACNARFPYAEIVKPEGPTCPVCKNPVPVGAELCPHCSAVLPFAGGAGARPKRRIRGEYAEEDLREVSRIPGVGPARAQALCAAGYNALWKIARASESELAHVKGIGAKTATEIKEALRFLLLIGRRKNREEILSEEYVCPLCGTVTALFATTCRGCGAAFDEEELDEGFRKEVEREEDRGLLAYYDVRLLEHPDVAPLHYARAMLLLSMGRAPDALASLDRALEIDPKDARALQAKTRALAGAKGIGSAAQVLRGVVSAAEPWDAAEESLAPAPEAAEDEALEALSVLEEVECPECGEKQVAGAKMCPVCGHRFVAEEPAIPPGGEGLEARLLEDLERAVAGEAKAPPPPLRPEVPETVVDKKRSMLSFLLSIPGVGRRAAEAISGFFQDLDQIRLSEVADLADIPGVAPAEARLVMKAVEVHFGTEEPAPVPPAKAVPLPPPRPARRALAVREEEVLPPSLPTPAPRPATPAPIPATPHARPAELTGSRRGLINGRGLVNGRGRVNGLINGSGFVNGSSVSELRLPKRNLAPRYLAIGVSLIMLFVIAASFIEPAASPGIHVDGSFADWQGIPEYAIQTSSPNPNIAIAAVSIDHSNSSSLLFVRVRVAGNIFGDNQTPDTLYVFLDTDGDAASGYAVSALGADYLVQASGYGGALQDARLSHFESSDPENWTGWTFIGTAASAMGQDTAGRWNVELSIADDLLGSPFAANKVRASFAFDDNMDHTTHTDVPINGRTGSLRVTQRAVGTLLATSGAQPFLQLTFSAFGFPVHVESVSPESTPSGRLGAPLAGGPPFDLNPGENRTVIWPIDTTGLAPLSTVSARVLSVVTNGSYLFENEPARAYVGAASPNKNIDGLFQDWAGATADSDLSPVRRASLDIKNSDGSVVGSDVYLYMKFGGTPLEGTPAPRRQARQQAPGGGGGGTSGSGTPPGRLVGYDYIRFFLRTDDTASGGIDVNGLLVDRYVELRGRERQVRSAAVYRWTGSSWQWEAPLTWAFGDVEVEVRASLPNATFRSSQIVGMTVDWMGVVDSASAQPTRAATRGAHGPVVLDISGQWYLRDTPPSDQMGCTVNRKAERTQGSSNKSVTLTGNESACWDVDDTSGQTVPAGDWQSVLDIYSSSPSDTTYNVIFQIWDKTNHQVVTTIGSCTGVSNYGNDQTCTIYSVGSQTIASDQVVRLRVERAGGGGTVRIDYDSGTSAGDSRLFLAIPEFHDVAFPVTLGATAVLAIAWMRRRKPAS